MRRVAVSGVAQTTMMERNRSESVQEMIHRVSHEALTDAGISREEIGTVIVGSSDFMDGIAINNVYSVEPAGAFLKDESKVAMDALFAAYYAWMRILSGAYDTALVVGWGKGSETDINTWSSLQADPFYTRPLGLDGIQAAALQSSAYMQRWGIDERSGAGVVVKNLSNARRNPRAIHRPPMDADEVMASQPLASPIKAADCPPITDGAAAIVLAAEDRARTPYAWIAGAGTGTDGYQLGSRDLTVIRSARSAARRAYGLAGIKDPPKEVHAAEVSEYCSFQELLLYEALGLCPEGQGGKFIETGSPFLDGPLPVNPSGGCLGANPMPCSGLVRLVEAVLQVAGKAGDHQVKNARCALAHGASGLAHQAGVVFVLRTQPPP